MKRTHRIMQQKFRRAGFTLVELLVSIALFSILVSIAAGGFVNALRSEREAAAMMSAQSNVSIALEQMTREMRTGYLFCNTIGGTSPSPACASSCIVDPSVPDPNAPDTHFWQCSNFLEYYNASGQRIDYSLDSQGVLYRSVDGTAQPLTGSNVSIKYLTFEIWGNTEGDHWNPRVTVSIGVAPNDPTVNWTTASLQTSVSAREIDCTQGASPSC